MTTRNIKAVPSEKIETPAPEENAAPPTIAKPSGKFNLNKFKSTAPAKGAKNIETMPTLLPVYKLAGANDFARLHPNEEAYWSVELCFISVPIKGQKHNTLHLIDEGLAMQFLQGKQILRFRLALGSKPDDVFFLCEVPTQNVDNSWNKTNLDACEKAKTLWTWAISQKVVGKEEYKIDFSHDADAFPEPNWPTQSLDELIERAFDGRIIDTADHPALLRKIGAKQKLT